MPPPSPIFPRTSPRIAFGQQPCGLFPRRFLVAKFLTARRLKQELGAEVVFFYHDADHDPRETKITLRHRKTDQPFEINFTFENKLQRKYTPLYLKRILPEWRKKTALQLQGYADAGALELLKTHPATTVADLCLAMYEHLGLLDGVTVVRSSDPAFREQACDITDYFADIPHEGEIVRARKEADAFTLHEGGDSYIRLPLCPITKAQISPSRDSRLKWMQSVLRCTHYIAGAGEQQYLNKADAPDITYIPRDTIDRSDEAWTSPET